MTGPCRGAGRSLRHIAVLALVTVPLALSAARAQQAAPAQPDSHQQMLALLRQVAEQTPAAHRYIGDGPAERLRAELAALPAAAPGPDRWRLTVRLADEELRLGNETEAIRLLRQARDLVPRAATDRSWLDYTLYRLGIAYLRLGETQNCARHPTANSCILPLRDDGIHRQQEPARRAIDAFEQVLDQAAAPHPEQLASGARERNLAVGSGPRGVLAEAASRRMAARWLLNIAYMAIGGYPGQVPEAHLIPPENFASTDPFPRFDNVAPALGLATFDMCGGALADDFDNDGYLDIVVSTWDTAGQLRLFRNNQDGTFSERTEQAGLLGLHGGLNIVQADYDNDGNVDILVLRGAWLGAQGRHPNSLLRNNGDGTFTDVTFAAGLGDAHYPSQTASWGDYDNDGDLDLYVGNETSRALVAPNQLFRNNGDGTFTDVAASAGVMNHRFAKAVIWGDYDGDRLPDLYVSNSDGANRLYRNTGRGTFIDEARRLGVGRPAESFPAWFWDVDNDGALDLYVSAYSAGIEHLAAGALGLPVNVELARLYRGTGDGRFDEVSEGYGLRQPVAAMGANFGDLDNDGYLDFYLGTGYPPYHSLMPGVMYRNRGGRAFADVTYAGRLRPPPEGPRRVLRRPRPRRRPGRVRADGRRLPRRPLRQRAVREPGLRQPLDHHQAGGRALQPLGDRGAHPRRHRRGRQPALRLPPREQRRQLRREPAAADDRPRLGRAHRAARSVLADDRRDPGVHSGAGGPDHPHRRGRAFVLDARTEDVHAGSPW